jgi:serine/threonine protein kinase
VYRAKVYGVAGMDREFAVKRFHPSLVNNARGAAALGTAARLYQGLDHPKVAKLQEFGVSGEETFAAVEYAPGIDLSQLMQQGRLPLGAAARLIVQVGRAVGYAHGKGLCHLGLAPTNIICSERGEIKVTDFGFLPPRLPAAPAEDSSLHLRLPYMAPEQLEGQETSPATDVYQLGTIAYELMVGRKPFAGKGGAELAQQMLGGAIPDSGLPRSFKKFLEQALARSPAERFPDAGAMADAMEAALRSFPIPGTEAEAGKAVTQRQESLSKQRESQASGVLKFPVPAPPQAPREEVLELAPDFTVRTPPPIPGSVARIKLAKKPVVSSRTPPPERPASQDMELDLLGETTDVELSDDRETIPSMDVPVLEESLDDEVGMLLGPAGTDADASPRQFIGGTHEDTDTNPIAHTPVPDTFDEGGVLDDSETLVRVNTPSTPDAPPFTEPPRTPAPVPLSAPLPDPVPQSAPLPDPAPQNAPVPDAGPRGDTEALDDMLESMRPTASGNSFDGAIRPVPMDTPYSAPGDVPYASTTPPLHAHEAKGGLPKPLVYLGGLGVMAGAAFLAFTLLSSQGGDGPKTAKTATTDGAGETDTTPDPDKGALVPGDAGTPVAAADATVAVKKPDKLEVGSEPEGAKVYLDGTLVGNTPLTLDASPDSHRLALILPGYALYTGDIDGHGIFKIDLNEVTPPEGPGGIKVRCKKTNRYYVFVDGNPVGQLCPSERIGVSKGDHVVEIYDPITDSRRAFNVEVVDTRLSLRVRVD